mmetsp:Transcript_78712/g.141981  ORF Transcript_78712/g.141981 Transcript_78712/m.141981 type:complete len:290 (-) Transcript_78712:1324-2193(-)
MAHIPVMHPKTVSACCTVATATEGARRATPLAAGCLAKVLCEHCHRVVLFHLHANSRSQVLELGWGQVLCEHVRQVVVCVHLLDGHLARLHDLLNPQMLHLHVLQAADSQPSGYAYACRGVGPSRDRHKHTQHIDEQRLHEECLTNAAVEREELRLRTRLGNHRLRLGTTLQDHPLQEDHASTGRAAGCIWRKCRVAVHVDLERRSHVATQLQEKALRPLKVTSDLLEPRPIASGGLAQRPRQLLGHMLEVWPHQGDPLDDASQGAVGVGLLRLELLRLLSLLLDRPHG